MNQPPSSMGRPGSAARGGLVPGGPPAGGRPPGTATRLMTGMVPGTGRPGTRGGMTGQGVALSAQVMVADRPTTQQGLGGMKTAAKGQRQVRDKTYYVGLLRSKINELSTEISKLQKEISTNTEEQSSYVTYEKRAEVLASEIKDLQGELGDYNTLVDKLNTDEDAQDIQMDCEDLKAQNDKEARTLDALFEQKQEREGQIRSIEMELEQEKRMADNMVANMENYLVQFPKEKRSEMRQKYHKLKDMNEHLLRQLESGQQELDTLNTKKANLEEELSASQVKQEAVRLYEQLHELEEKRDQLLLETQSKSSPQEERERLLRQVKEDNQEIASMERQTNDIRERVNTMQEEVRQLDIDIEENQGERNQKYKELKKREETMNEFLANFTDTKAQETERISQLEQNIVMILENMSRNLGRFGALPTPQELANMKDDLAFKEGEMQKAQSTASGLAGESQKLAQDLQKVEQLEAKITSELDQIKTKIATMSEELVVYSDLDRLKREADERKKKLQEDKITLAKRRDTFKKATQHLTAQYEGLKAQLNDNETHAQLGNLERKWQHHEQNNFVMKEFIAAKTMECDFRVTANRVRDMIANYNFTLQGGRSGTV